MVCNDRNPPSKILVINQLSSRLGAPHATSCLVLWNMFCFSIWGRIIPTKHEKHQALGRRAVVRHGGVEGLRHAGRTPGGGGLGPIRAGGGSHEVPGGSIAMGVPQ